MANAKCPNCGAEAIDTSSACPQCGYTDKEVGMESPDSRAVLWVGFGFIALLVLWAVVLEPLMTQYNPFK